MIPLKDDSPSALKPYVTMTLIAACACVFLWQRTLDPVSSRNAVAALGAVPAVLLTDARLPADLAWVPRFASPFTSMFLHGGWMHLGGNMLYLWIFGDNLEKVMGHARFLLFYLACGIAAGLAHILVSSGSSVPTVGASGAISGVLGGYLVMFPRNHVRVLTRGGIVALPAIAVLGFWIVIQLINGLGSLGVRTESGGVAYMAHVGGFVAGVVLVKLLAARRPAIA